MAGGTQRILGSDCIPLAANSDVHREQASRHFSKEGHLSEEKKMTQVARSKSLHFIGNVCEQPYRESRLISLSQSCCQCKLKRLVHDGNI